MSSRGSPPGRSKAGCAEARHDRRFKTDRARAAVDDEVDAAAQVGEHMRGAGRRDMAGAVGGRRHHRAAECREQRLRGPVRRHAHRDAVEPGEREVADRTIRPLRQHQRQRPRPERGGQPLGVAIEQAEPARAGNIGDMRDQRIEGRPPLGGIEPRHRLALAGVGAEPIDGLGREGGKPAGGQAARGGRNCGWGGGQNPGSRLNGHRNSSSLRLGPRRGYKTAASRSVAQSGSAPRSGRGGRRFKSCHSDQRLPP